MREALRGILRQPGVAARVRQRRKEEGFDKESEEEEEEEEEEKDKEEEEEKKEEEEMKKEIVEKKVVDDEEPGSTCKNDRLVNFNETQKETKEGSQEPSVKTGEEEEAASSMQRSAPLPSHHSDDRHTEIPAIGKHVTAAPKSSSNMSSEASAKLLMQLGKAGDLAGVKALIKQGVDVNSRCKDDEFEQTALHEAAERGDLSMVKVLLKAGANFKVSGSGMTFAGGGSYRGGRGVRLAETFFTNDS
jgi:chemotaxis protein histidine kinase CheA